MYSQRKLLLWSLSDSVHLRIFVLFLLKSFPLFLCPYCSSDVTCAEDQVNLGGGFYSLLYHMCDDPVVTKPRKISNKFLQISRGGLMEPSEQQKVQVIGFMVKEGMNKAQWLLVSNCNTNIRIYLLK